MISRKHALLAIVLIVLVGCVAFLYRLHTRHKDMSLSEALAADLPLQVYSLEPNDLGITEQIRSRYYYTDFGDELLLTTYFVVGNTKNDSFRVARLEISTLSRLQNNELIDRITSINWAHENSGASCRVFASVTDKEAVPGPEYQSCLYWIANNSFYRFYSIWPEAEAVRAVNALSEATVD